MNIAKKTLLRPDINSRTKHLLNTLASFCNKHQNRIGWYTQSVIAECMSMSTRTVQRALKDALDIGLVSVRRRWRKCNEYTVNCLVKPRFYDDTVAQERTTSFKKYNDSSQNAVDIYPIKKGLDPTIVGDIEKLLNSSKDRAFWIKIARKCSPDAVRAALSSLRTAMREQVIRKPAAYLTAIIKAEHPGIFGNRQHGPVPDIPTQKPVEPLRPLTDEQWQNNLDGLHMIMSKLRC